MATAFRVVTLAVVCAVIGVMLRERIGVMAVLLSLASCAIILFASLHFLAPALEFADRLQQLSSLDSSLISPLLKVTALGIITQLSEGLCEDAGDKALSKTVRVCGTVFSVYVSLPLFGAVMDLIETVLGG